MNILDSYTSPATLCKALSDVTGLTFDMNDENELAAAAVLVQKLANDPHMANALAGSVIAQCNPFAAREHKSLRNVRLRVSPGRPAIDDALNDDAPTEAVSAPRPRSALDLLDVSWRTRADVDTMVQRHPDRYVSYSPQALGFATEGDSLYWPIELPMRWESFLRMTEASIVPNGTLLARLRASLQRKTVYSVEHKAKNYGCVHLQAGADSSAAHFLFDAETLYLVVEFNSNKPSRSKVRVGDVESLKQKMICAFDGHHDYARGILSSMRHAFAH